MPPELTVESHHFEALGTSCSLFAAGQSRGRLVEGEFWVRRVGARLTRFAADSELSRLNACAGHWMEISDELGSVLKFALTAYETSGGLVNAAVLPSMLAIGYTSPLADGPAVATLDGVGPLPPLPDVLEVSDDKARVASGSGVDLGGVAKGWMADRLREFLGPNSVANLGGDLMAIGPGPRAGGWSQLIRRPGHRPGHRNRPAHRGVRLVGQQPHGLLGARVHDRALDPAGGAACGVPAAGHHGPCRAARCVRAVSLDVRDAGDRPRRAVGGCADRRHRDCVPEAPNAQGPVALGPPAGVRSIRAHLPARGAERHRLQRPHCVGDHVGDGGDAAHARCGEGFGGPPAGLTSTLRGPTLLPPVPTPNRLA